MNAPVISSPSNPLIKEILKIKSGKKGEREGRCIIEGPHLIEMALSSQAVIERVLFTAEFLARQDGRRLLRSLLRKVPAGGIVEVSAPVINRLSDTETPQGILAVVIFDTAVPEGLAFGNHPLVVICDGIQDPGNLGSLIRVSDAAGADAVFILPGTCNPYLPKVIRSTAGSIFHIPLIPVSPEACVDFLRTHHIPLAIADVRGAVSLFDADLTGPLALAFGSEARGAGRVLREKADVLLKIPIVGKAESLNVAMAASICLYETVRQRVAPHCKPGRK